MVESCISVAPGLSFVSIEAPKEEESSIYRWKVTNPLLRECMAEMLGTFILLAFGDGVVAQTVLSDGAKGSMTTITLGWGLAVFLGIHFSGGVSGAHMNPAVTVALATFKRLPWKKVLPYILSQIVGAFLAAFAVYCVYYPALNHRNDFTKATAGIFATYPEAYQTNWASLFTEVFATAMLVGAVFAISDEKNQPASKYTAPSAVALTVVAIGMSFGNNTGYAINPARDFGPRLFTSMAGWGAEVFQYDNHYFIVPIVGPLIGGIVGAGMYEIMVGMHHP